MERIKVESQRDAITQVASEQAKAVVSLIGMVGKCAVMLSQTSKLLKTAVEEGRDGLDGTVKAAIATMQLVADSNDDALKALVGQSAMAHASDAEQPVDVFSQYSLKVSHRTSAIGVPSLKPKVTRRSVSGGSTGSPGRKTHRNSPKKPRISASSIPHRRLSEKEKKKGVQWRDEVGKGNLIDSSMTFENVSHVNNAAAPPRSASRTGSESEWEDEKTEDSVTLNLFSLPSRDALSANHSKRPRPGRDPNLRVKGTSTLASLAEDDRESDPRSLDGFRKASPLSPRNMNTALPDDSLSSLHIPKGSPSKRVPPTPRAVGSSRSGRRRSNIGPMRSEKTRRRSSLIPQLSPQEGGGNSGPKRVPVSSGDSSIHRSPGRKVTRLSMLTARSASSMKLKPTGGMTSFSSMSFADPNASVGDLSFRGGRPTWR